MGIMRQLRRSTRGSTSNANRARNTLLNHETAFIASVPRKQIFIVYIIAETADGFLCVNVTLQKNVYTDIFNHGWHFT